MTQLPVMLLNTATRTDLKFYYAEIFQFLNVTNPSHCKGIKIRRFTATNEKD